MKQSAWAEARLASLADADFDSDAESEGVCELEDLYVSECAPLEDEGAPALSRQNTDFVAVVDGEWLISDNRRCSDWVVFDKDGVTTSREFTHDDISWLESAAGCGRGDLFRMLREEEDPTSLPWEPMARYAAFAPMLKQRRGSKSIEHEDALRRSDPASNPRTWIDWARLKDEVAAVEAAKAKARARARLPAPAPPSPKAVKESLDVWPSLTRSGSGKHDKARDSSDTVLALLPLEEDDDESSGDESSGARLGTSAATDACVAAARATARKLDGTSNVLVPPYLEPNYF